MPSTVEVVPPWKTAPEIKELEFARLHAGSQSHEAVRGRTATKRLLNLLLVNRRRDGWRTDADQRSRCRCDGDLGVFASNRQGYVFADSRD